MEDKKKDGRKIKWKDAPYCNVCNKRVPLRSDGKIRAHGSDVRVNDSVYFNYVRCTGSLTINYRLKEKA